MGRLPFSGGPVLLRRILAPFLVVLLLLLGRAASIAVRESRRQDELSRCLFAARAIGMATQNRADTGKCWPALKDRRVNAPLGWRTELWNFIEPARARTPEELRAFPAGIFHLGDPASSTTNVYAIVGPGTAFSPEQPCDFDEAPAGTLLYVSGRPSVEPWHRAGDVRIEDLDQEGRSIKEVVGEAIEGRTFLVYRDGEVKVVDSSEPASELARQARWRSRRAR